ncbi:MAG: TIM barrel protein [Chloroflexota bacterium]
MRLAISSWTVHGELSNGLDLLDFPNAAAEHGVHTLEICHFHLPSTEDTYLSQLSSAINDAGCELYSILIDDGDIASADETERAESVAFNKQWIEVAATLGAERVRVDAGLQDPIPEAVNHSAASMAEIAAFADSQGIIVSTENWRTTSREPGPLLEIMQKSQAPLGLCVDFGNAEYTKTANKYETMSMLLPQATSLHVKARYGDDGSMDTTEFIKCMDMVESAGFDGPITLIYNDQDNEWAHVDELRDVVLPYVH